MKRGKYEAPRRRRRRRSPPLLPVLLILLVVAVGIFVAIRFLDDPKQPGGEELSGSTGSTSSLWEQLGGDKDDTTEPEEVTTTMPEPEKVVSTATIGCTGDILMHMPVVNTGLNGGTGTYNFDNVFKYFADTVSQVDYAVANLETTLCGTDNGYNYSGYPAFNCPDEIALGARDAGFDMLLTANNHCYDTRTVGIKRTLSVIQDYGMDTLGTQSSAEDPKYLVKDINGIQIGMICYTYETGDNYPDRPSINAILTGEESLGMINSFDYSQLEKFYTEIDGHINAMKNDGAEAIVLFIHWGDEYQLTQNGTQTMIAQKMCDLGVDVIVGGHPHVVQPMDLLTSTADPSHKTVCLYSMGNAVSNQRLGNLSSITTAHTEDGVFFTFTFAKYSDGNVVLQGTDLIPCWVNLHTNGGKQYNILPLDKEVQDQWKTLYDLGDTTYNAAVNSYDRTMAIAGEGLTECQTWLEQSIEQLEAEYLAAVQPNAA